MLMSNTDRPARLHYQPNGFRVINTGDHVICAVSKARIPLDTLRYWNVVRQEAYGSAQIASEALAPR